MSPMGRMSATAPGADARAAGQRDGRGRVATWLLCVLLAAGAIQARAAAADAAVAREYRAEAALDVGVDGHITAMELTGEVPATLAGPARQAIARWRFKPPVRDGHAATARTYVRLVVQVVQQADGNYGLRAVYRSNGPKLILTQPPAYPINELRQRGQGTIVMEAIVHPDGTLGDIHAASHRINHPNPGAFITSAEVVLRHAHAQPELVDGQPVATRIQLPFVYALNPISRSEALTTEAGRQAAGASAGGSGPVGEAVALDSPVQLIAGPPG
ncbi:energy transducer TonB [Frateuria sp. MAH-13]|uniref:Energy transducer TonB n=1 Tax=Frateuria flava TaxID=2821489 RepID=A0ABS4DPJ2_9GAMM|nr:energy transducer TonB [Frateuria flava]MBP1474984.1 energy transducer TonB [Frateuria flava]